ncbi:RES family NAD+ phosphorylase [Synechococcus sp. PCC 7336]|uniref:RES family NAD+ phosphorylase n=1 Tax=Synechococcus sp. PCC 7336 TaxID=195250 RepID=UPI00036C6D9D|nr:RES family NAD+ phosphorylase [Synechococcus sp. PCC 7336]
MPEPLMVWRLSKRKYAPMAFSGEGGLYVAGRWTPKGYRAAYTSESLALASLEVFVHAETNNIPLIGIRAYLNEPVIEVVPVKKLPIDWQETSAYPQLQSIGDRWLKNLTAPILKVPSAIVPMEYNYILNPAHPDLQIVTEPPITFQFDRRMWKSF